MRDTIDNILQETDVGRPKLVSITTNGAEIPILKGMKNTLKHVPFVSLAPAKTLIDHMTNLGYEYVGPDDRGHSFRACDSASFGGP